MGQALQSGAVLSSGDRRAEASGCACLPEPSAAAGETGRVSDAGVAGGGEWRIREGGMERQRDAELGFYWGVVGALGELGFGQLIHFVPSVYRYSTVPKQSAQTNFYRFSFPNFNILHYCLATCLHYYNKLLLLSWKNPDPWAIRRWVFLFLFFFILSNVFIVYVPKNKLLFIAGIILASGRFVDEFSSSSFSIFFSCRTFVSSM